MIKDMNIEHTTTTIKDFEFLIPTEFKNRFIAIAEDLAINRSVLRGMLEAAHIDVLEASNGFDLIDKLSLQQKQPDLIFMDMQMPIMSGPEAARLLRSHSWNGPIVATTSSINEADRVLFEQAGINDFLHKPINSEDLWGVLTRWVMPINKDSTINPRIKMSLSIDSTDLDQISFMHRNGIDIKNSINRFLGNSRDLITAFLEFYNDHCQDFFKLQDLLKQRDLENFKIVNHDLMGCANTVGYNAIGKACARIDGMLRNKDFDAIKNEIAAIEIYFLRFSKFCNTVI
jgi:CheY-like chemotaxis protein